VTALEQDLGGASDSEVAAVCQKEGLVLITMDTDFADIRSYPPAEFPGLVVLRLHSQDKPHVVDVLGRLTPLLSTEPLRRHLWIVDETRLRIRG
jgi:predicted nuclease of predicted toxin-antitoxin system